ncbi:hypothetical protein B0H16DRAFT_1903146 [Mycena metata]|uniref:Uncharacterized protein n=1 Tax=Mycena metata TaxID=1033252 RepID=A0AAD7GL20_9AGAR|nr:hypothetical protein B0H16DRAFT_1903146 [Mycena metata]
MGILIPPGNDRSRNPPHFRDARLGAEERSLRSPKTSLSCTQFNAHKARGACTEFPDALSLLARDDGDGRGLKRQRQRQSSPPSASDAVSSISTAPSSVLASSFSTPFSVSTSDTASSSAIPDTPSSSGLPPTTTTSLADSTSIISTSTTPASSVTTTSDTITTSTPLSATTTESDSDSTPGSTSTTTTTSDTGTTSPPLSATETDTDSTTTTTSDTITTSPPLSATSETDTDSTAVSTSTTTSDTGTTSPPLSATTTESDTDSTTTTSDTVTTSPPLSATTTESDSDSPPGSTSTATTASASSTPAGISATSGISSSGTTSVSASVISISASSIIVSSASADLPSSSSSALLSAPSPDSSIRLSSMAPFSPSGSTLSDTTTVLSSPSITGPNTSASPASPLQAPTGFSTPPPTPPTPSPDFDSTFTSPALLTHLGVATFPAPSGSPSLFTTTLIYTSHGSLFTTVSTGVLPTSTTTGTGRPFPAPHSLAHNPAALIALALGCVAALILIVLGVFCACARWRPRRAHREFMLRGAARGLRRPAGAWRSPVEGESVYSLVLDNGDDHGDTSLLQAESGMREVRAADPFLDAAHISGPFAQTQTPDLISLHDAIWLPSSSRLSIPALLGRPSGTPSPTPSSLLNPPPSSSTAAGASFPAPAMPHGLREPITQSQSILPSANTEPTALPTLPAVNAELPSPAPSGLLRPSLAAHDSARTLKDHVDHSSRLVGPGAVPVPVPHRAESGDTFNSDTDTDAGVRSMGRVRRFDERD